MTDNIVINDGGGLPRTLATQETSGVHTPKHIVTSSALPTGAATSANQDTIVTQVGAVNETAYAGSGSKGLNGILKGIFNVLTGAGGNTFLKTQPQYSASGVTAVTGSFTGATASAAFTPIAGRPFNINLSGTFSATVRLERSFDGTTWYPLTKTGTAYLSFTAPCSESHIETEVGVQYRANCSVFSSGTITYRLSQ